MTRYVLAHVSYRRNIQYVHRSEIRNVEHKLGIVRSGYENWRLSCHIHDSLLPNLVLGNMFGSRSSTKSIQDISLQYHFLKVAVANNSYRHGIHSKFDEVEKT